MLKTNNWIKLSSVADIRQGFTFREKVLEEPHGNAHLVQIKDMREIYNTPQKLDQKIVVNKIE